MIGREFKSTGLLDHVELPSTAKSKIIIFYTATLRIWYCVYPYNTDEKTEIQKSEFPPIL